MHAAHSFVSATRLPHASQPDSDRSVPSISLTVAESPTLPDLNENRRSPGPMASPIIEAANSTDAVGLRSLSPVNDSVSAKVASKEGAQLTKRRPPSLVIDQSLTSLQSISNSSTNPISSESQKTSPSSTIALGKPAKSAKEIIQGLALHCVSPGLPPMNYEMLENVMKTKAIEKQQRQLIASRQKPADGSPELNSTANSDRQNTDESMEDVKEYEHEVPGSGNESCNGDMDRMRMKVPAPQLHNRAPPHSAMAGRSLEHERAVSSVAETGRRAPRPPSIRIVDPAQYQEGGYERAIRSAPLVNSMGMEESEESQHNASKGRQIDPRMLSEGIYSSRRPVSSPAFHRNRLTVQKSRYGDTLNDGGALPVPHSAKPALSSAGISIRARVHPEVSGHTRKLSAHGSPFRPDVYYSQSGFSHPPLKRTKHRRELHSTLQPRRPFDSECECEECRMANPTTGDEMQSVKRKLGEERVSHNRMKRQKFLELCAEMWDLIHEA
ncbi:hypothetical protein V1517DRAFT_344974 [Lipomyces orientalis]|uniref:Uncharacterized protein n=1 Tax=Lipomyces orientalis TaxID=1233043 RepID=A0ACC3TSS9_9ASCO